MDKYIVKVKDLNVGTLDLDKLTFEVNKDYPVKYLPMPLYPNGADLTYQPTSKDVLDFIYDRTIDESYEGTELILEHLSWDVINHIELLKRSRGIRPDDFTWLCKEDERYKFDDVHLRGKNCDGIYFK